MDFTVNLGRLTPDVARKVRAGFEYEDVARYKLGVLEQLRLKRLHDSLPQLGTALGGELRQRLVLSQDQWNRVLRRYGQKCMADPDFAPWLAKQNPDFTVPDRRTKIQTGWSPK